MGNVEDTKNWPSGGTALMVAAKCGRIQALLMLVKSGIDVWATDATGRRRLNISLKERRKRRFM